MAPSMDDVVLSLLLLWELAVRAIICHPLNISVPNLLIAKILLSLLCNTQVFPWGFVSIVQRLLRDTLVGYEATPYLSLSRPPFHKYVINLHSTGPRALCQRIFLGTVNIHGYLRPKCQEVLDDGGMDAISGFHLQCPVLEARGRARATAGETSSFLASNGCSDAHASGVCSRSMLSKNKRWKVEAVGDVPVVVFASLHISPRTWSVRVGFLMTFGVGMVLLAAYSARLIASITVKQHSLPFTSLEGLLKKDTHRLGVHKDSAEYNVLKSAKNGTLQSIFTTRMTREPQDYPIAVLSGLERICADRKYAFVTAAKLAKYYFIRVNCTIDQVPDPFMTGDGFLIFSKQNPYVRIINHYLRMMQNSGLMSKLYAKSFYALTREDSLSNTSVDVESAAPIFTLLSIGIITGVIVLGIELGMKSFIQKQSRYHREQLAFRQ
uniref:Ionotropic glutamate receptor C-terminal domain-containing protein n=1 Tax=Timema bartmani TaxID=61472 RepID=A0A7R9F8P0_9NEOP|nr:unnamed protein product [Timema bartmani]